MEHLNCDTCLTDVDPCTRALMGCAFLPAHPDAMPWAHDGDIVPPPTICPAYACSLPEVTDIARCFAHWKDGGGLQSVQVRCGGQVPPRSLMDGIEYLAGSIGSWEAKKHDKNKGGGHGTG